MPVRYLYDTKSELELIYCSNSQISYPLHNHVSIITLGIILDGSIQLITDVGSRTYYKDQTFVIPPYMAHSIKAHSVYTLLSLCIRTSTLNYCNMDQVKGNITNLLLHAPDSFRISKRQDVQLLSRLDSFTSDPPAFDSCINEPYIEELKQQLVLFPESKISIEEMAQTAFISKYHFIRSFKRVVGLTPHQFQIQNRIRKAQRLINHICTITEVALTTGFCDQSHFIKQFEKYVGLTPTGYKMSCGILSPIPPVNLTRA